MKESLICFCIYLFFILCIDLFLFLLYIFFISFWYEPVCWENLCAQLFLIFVIWGRTITWHNYFCIPLIIHIFILKFSAIGMAPFADCWNVTDTYFLLNESFIFTWLEILTTFVLLSNYNFFLIECYVRAFWILYVEFVFQNRLTFSQFLWNW